jgi:hypothetical protein
MFAFPCTKCGATLKAPEESSGMVPVSNGLGKGSAGRNS